MAHCSTSAAEIDTCGKPNLKEDSKMCKQIHVDLKGTVLTPPACASLVNELLKTLIFQKSQIPFPYNWLKTVVDRRRQNNDRDSNAINSKKVAVEKYFRLASSAYDNTEDIMCHIRREMEVSDVHEVIILFGTTPHSPKQAYSIKLPPVIRGHLEVIHQETNSRNQHNVLRQILLSDVWSDATGKALPSTNLYVMLKKRSRAEAIREDHFFVPNRKFSLSERVENVVINFLYEDDKIHNCCSELKIFEDEPKDDTRTGSAETDDLRDDCQWYQAKILVTGFKDYFVGKISASDLW